MASKAFLQAPALTHEKSLKTLVENRTVFTLENCELNIFETYQQSTLVPLKFNDLVVTSMLRGKKVMHLFDEPGFDYLPGETVVIPANEIMKIDFPEAKTNNPTQCLALAIDQFKIAETLDFLNDKYPKEGGGKLWQLNAENYFFYNNVELANTINKLIKECMSSNITKDAIVDLTLQELLIRIIQSQNVKSIEIGTSEQSHNPIRQVIKFIHSHLTEGVDLKRMSEEVGMSQTSFYRYFKRELGMSPLEFIINEKIKFAKQLLKDQQIHINEVGYMAGFSDCNYFIRLFKKYEGITPKQYQLLYIS